MYTRILASLMVFAMLGFLAQPALSCSCAGKKGSQSCDDDDDDDDSPAADTAKTASPQQAAKTAKPAPAATTAKPKK